MFPVGYHGLYWSFCTGFWVDRVSLLISPLLDAQGQNCGPRLTLQSAFPGAAEPVSKVESMFKPLHCPPRATEH